MPVRSFQNSVKQFRADFQWIGCSHLRITLRGARYISFNAAFSQARVAGGFSAFNHEPRQEFINRSQKSTLLVGRQSLDLFHAMEKSGYAVLLTEG